MSNVIQFTIKGVDKASGAFKSVTQSVTNTTKAVAKAAFKVAKVLAVAFVAAGTAAFAMAKRVADLQDSVAKMSTRLGIAVDKLSEFHHAAELGGITTTTFDMALQRMARRVAEAGEGMGEAKAALVELGLEAKSLSDLPLDQQMMQVADALDGVEGQADKVRLAFKLFDSEGVSMLQTMEGGSQAFRDAAADLEYLGGVMNKQGTANAEKFKDSMTRVGAAFNGLSMGIGNSLIPMMTGLATAFANFIADNRVKIVNFIKTAITGFLTFGYTVKQVFTTVKETISNILDPATMSETLGNIAQGFADMLKAVVDLVAKAGPYMAEILIASFAAGWSAFKELGAGALDYVFDFITGQDLARPFGQIVADAVRAAQSELGGLPESFNNIKDIVIDTAKSTGGALTSIFGINTDLAKQQAITLMETLSVFGTASEEMTNKAKEQTQTFMDYMREQSSAFLGDQKSFTEEFAESVFNTMMTASAAVGEGFASILVDGANGAKLVKQLAKSVLKEIIASYVTMKVQRLILAKTEASTSVALAGANTMASMSLAPFPVNLTAPAVAVTHQAIAASMAAGALAGVAHGGLGNVPSESTFLLQKGERVLSPNQNRDLTDFLSGGGGGVGDVTVNVFTTARDFNDVVDSDVREFVAGQIIPAMDELDKQGVRPSAIERSLV